MHTVTAVCVGCGETFTKDIYPSYPGVPSYCTNKCRAKYSSRRLAEKRAAELSTTIWDRADRSGGNDSCWVWKGKTVTGGYGYIKILGKSLLAHRVAYELAIGPIPAGLTIDHLCRTRGCINPAHLECVTLAENLRRKPVTNIAGTDVNTWSRNCEGHLQGRNRYVSPSGALGCRKCMKAASDRYRARKRSSENGAHEQV